MPRVTGALLTPERKKQNFRKRIICAIEGKRRANGLTQKELAAVLDMSQVGVSKLLNADPDKGNCWTLENFSRAAMALGLDDDEIIRCVRYKEW